MPTASVRPEKTASADAADPIKQLNIILEKKVRNLEKRKLKLDNYKSDVQNGKELNEDQKSAVNKYDQVIELLEYSKELCKLLNALTQESLRAQKKLAKKEQIERQQYEIQRLREAFYFKHLLSALENEAVRNDFLAGENGAKKLSPDDLHSLDQLYKLIGPNCPNDHADLESYFHVQAESLIFLVEGKNKEIAGSTYKSLKELLLSIKECGYFTRAPESNDEVSSDDAPEMEEPPAAPEEKPQSCEVEPPFTNGPYASESHVQEEVVENEVPCELMNGTDSTVNIVQEAAPENVVPAYATQNGSLQEVLESQSSFNFLQESQIELDTPHMDPAVVAVHQMPPSTTMNYSIASFSAAQQIEEPQKLSNGIEHISAPMAPQPPMPIMSSAVPRTVPSVMTSVPHNSPSEFDPSHPIPTQTFTNQSFAVMPNMIMPPAYVPVTMHHGPLPPHIAPLAVVPGLSTPVSTPTTVVPIQVAVASVPVTSEADHQEAIHNNELQNGEPEVVNGNISGPEPTNNQNAVSGEKMPDGEGFTTQNNYHRGFRGRGRGRGMSNNFFRGRGSYSGRGSYQNNYYQGNFRRGPRGGRGGNNMRGGRGNYRQQQQSQQNQ